MFDGIIDLVLTIWRADSERRDASIVGESKLDNASRKTVAVICGGLIATLFISGCIIWWILL